MLNLTEVQIKLIEDSGVSVDALEVFWRLFSEQNLDTAIGGVLTLLKGGGQKRNERFGPPGEPSKEFVEASKLKESPITPE